MELRTGLSQERVILEKIQPSLDGIVKVFRVADFGIIVGERFVVANPAKVSEHLASGDRRGFLRERRTIFLYRGVKIEPSTIPELHGSRGGEGFGD